MRKQGNPNFAKTIDVSENKAESIDNRSAGGTRYVIGVKPGGLKFYGSAASNADKSDSDNQSRGPMGQIGD